MQRELSSRSGRRLALVALLVGLLLVLAAPALAITYGELDGDAHPFVGSIVISIPDQGYFQYCSGTLIAEQVFLTASHCTAGLDDLVARIPGAEVLVTFDPTINGSSAYYSGQWYTNPNYGGPASDTGDIAVIVLDQAPGIAPAQLPAEGLLDELQAAHVLHDTRFTAVGYGTIRETKQGAFAAILDNVDRRQAEQGFLSLTGAWLRLAMTPDNGNGGTCYGDSGGPHFIHLDGVETNIVAAITVTGDAPCKALDTTYRVDTPQARAFLSPFVTLP